jgi:hypothetical protein
VKLDEELYRRLVVANSIVVLLALMASVGFVTARRERIAASLSALVVSEKSESRFLRSLGIETPVEKALAQFPRYEFKIKPVHYRQIEVLAAQMARRGALLEEDKRWFPLDVRHEGEVYGAKIRMRGDLAEHWSGPKKSWRVKFKSERYPDGYRSLDFIIPGDKAYEVEVVAYAMARELGLLVPDAGFARVTLNGVDMGLYLWIERYGKEMLERQGYPRGEIFRERNTWVQTRWTGYGVYRTDGDLRLRSSNFATAIEDEPGARHYARRWHDFLALIREGENDEFEAHVGDYLDLEKYLTWNALTWLFGSVHAHWSDNLRWYYDDTVGRFEPILYDVNRFPIDNRQLGTFEAADHDPLAKRLLSIPRFQQRRNEILWRLLHDDRFDAAQRSHEAWQRIRPALVVGVGAGDPETLDREHRETLEILRANRDSLRDHLAFARAFVTPLVEGEDRALVLEIVPDAMAPLRLDALALEPRSVVAEGASVRAILTPPTGVPQPLTHRAAYGEEGRVALEFEDAILHTPRDALIPFDAVWTLRLEGLDLPAGGPASVEASLRNTITGDPVEGHRLFQTLPLVRDRQPSDVFDVASGRAAGLPLRRDGRRLVLSAGRHRVAADLRVPPGYTLVLEPGVVIEMAPGVSIISRSRVEALGNEAQPIVVEAADPDRPWGVFAVVRAPERSELRHFQVSGGSESRIDGLFVSGQLAFHSSPVALEDCIVSDARADDGLNVKRARVEIRRCRFQGNTQDGFDGDWITGDIRHSLFSENGGDGLDLSGSHLTLSDTLFSGMGDKAISAGERTELSGFNLVLRDSEIGIAVKDLSQVALASSVLFGNQTGLSLYRKKPLFGGGHAEVASTLFWRNGHDLFVDAESSLDLVAVAMESFDPTPRVTATDVRTGGVARAYREEGDDLFRFLGGEGFLGANPSHPLPETFAAPDLARGPIGNVRPVGLP